MDIDEFLDKEVPAKREEPKREEFGSAFITQAPAEPRDAKPYSFPDAGKKGSIEALENDYLELWGKVSKDRFGWSSSLYADITRAGDEIKKALSIMSSKVDNEKTGIRRLISSAKNALQNKNYDEALKLYSEITSMRNSIPDAFFEEKKEINREILPFYAELAGQIDIKLTQDFNDSAAKADSLIRGSFSSIGKKDIANAKNFYEKALEIYKNLPHGFLEQKIEMGNNLIALYKELSIIMQIGNLQQELSQKMADGAYNHIASDERLKHLSEIARHKKDIHKGLKKHAAISGLRNLSQGQNSKDILDRMISRRLEKANESMGKGLFPDARKNIESVLRLDPQNKDAKSMLKKMQ